jgi:hypothetical protein
VSTAPDNPDIEEATISWHPSRVVFTQTPDWILHNADINDAAFRTWMTIASFASNKAHTAFPSARTLMKLRGKGRRIIFEHIRQLEAAGLLVREARYRPNGGRTSSHYTLAWDRPLTPVQNCAPHPRAEDCPSPRAEERARPDAAMRAPRTTTTHELDPLPPSDSPTNATGETVNEQGATAPRTPRSRRSSRREDGTNPRAVDAQAAKEHQMRQWARNMSGALDHDEFAELVNAEVLSHKITRELAQFAIDESLRLRGMQEAESAL